MSDLVPGLYAQPKRMRKAARERGWEEARPGSFGFEVSQPPRTLFFEVWEGLITGGILREGPEHGGMRIHVDQLMDVLEGVVCICPAQGVNGDDVTPDPHCPLLNPKHGFAPKEGAPA
jgi:hypothetical protein